MMINMQNYRPTKELTKEILKENNFKYVDGYYTYRFPVCKYKKELLLWASIYINLEHMTCAINVVDERNNTYASYHNRTYGRNELVEAIDKKIKTQINKLVKEEILVQKKEKVKK